MEEKMTKQLQGGSSRRDFLRACLIGGPAALALAACTAPLPPSPAVAPREPANEVAPTGEAGASAATDPVADLPPTPACGDDDDVPTLAQTAGPFYTPNSPERTSLLEPEIEGTPMVLTGYVLTTDCRPVVQALVDFWHCDAHGVYDNTGYRLRGHQFTREDGSYTLETIVPGLYPGRTRHFHVNVQPANGAILTTQLYFPDEPGNARDGIFRPELLMDTRQGAEGVEGHFNFVLRA
jgi:protocatechuate 3,4-dioxygenase beta subunit